MKEWKFLYDEETFDGYPNFIGIISNGNEVLFYHGHTTNSETEKEIFEVFDSFKSMMTSDSRITSFQWTAENEEKFLNFLNSLPEDSTFYGDDSALLNFNPNDNK